LVVVSFIGFKSHHLNVSSCCLLTFLYLDGIVIAKIDYVSLILFYHSKICLKVKLILQI